MLRYVQETSGQKPESEHSNYIASLSQSLLLNWFEHREMCATRVIQEGDLGRRRSFIVAVA